MGNKKVIISKEMDRERSVFLFNNCNFYGFGKAEDKNVYEQMNNIAIVQKQTDIFSVAKYIIFLQNNIRNLIQQEIVLNIPETNRNLKYFTFTSAKLQKIIIISLLQYLYQNLYQNNQYENENIDEKSIENIINDLNPIKDINTLINKKCGLSIDYNFMKFGLTSVFNNEDNCDTENSLFCYKKDTCTNYEIINMISNEKSTSSINMFLFSSIPNELKKIIVNVTCEFILFPAYELGTRINNLKPDDWDYDKEIQLTEIFIKMNKNLNGYDYIECLKTVK